MGIIYGEAVTRPKTCSFCSSPLKRGFYINSTTQKLFCDYCGWAKIYQVADVYSDKINDKYLEERLISQEVTTKVFRKFDIESSELSFAELGKYLSINSHKLLNISPRRLELLIGDIYKNQGFHVILTKATHDQGKDLILLDDGNDPIIVEIKRYKKKIGVDVIRRLRGVQLTYGHKRAILVATNYFTKKAITEMNSTTAKEAGYDMELNDIEDILRYLQIYNQNDTLIQKQEHLTIDKK